MMKTVSIDDFESQFDELFQEVEKGEIVVVTRNNLPIFDMIPHKAEKHGGMNFAAGQAYLLSKGIKNPIPFIADDFDDPLPEDFLLRPLPED